MEEGGEPGRNIVVIGVEEKKGGRKGEGVQKKKGGRRGTEICIHDEKCLERTCSKPAAIWD